MKQTLKYALAWMPLCLLFELAQPALAQAANKRARAEPAAAASRDAETARRRANKETVFAFYRAAARADFEVARKFVGDYYIEHDPERYDGLPGLQKALDYNRRAKITLLVIPELAVADGDYVTLYSHVAQVRSPPAVAGPGGPPGGGAMPPPKYNLVGDIFRLADGKIVEHWNAVLQPR